MVVGNDRAADFLRLQAQKRIIELDSELEEIDRRIDISAKAMEFDRYYQEELSQERAALDRFLGVVF